MAHGKTSELSNEERVESNIMIMTSDVRQCAFTRWNGPTGAL